MLEGKDFDELDSLFIFVAAFVDGAMAEQHPHLITHVHASSFKL